MRIMLPLLRTRVPGPKSRALLRDLHRHESRNITFASAEFPVFWNRARGQNVWDADGNRYLDLTSGFGVATAGFTPGWGSRTIARQAARLYHAMGDVHPTAEKTALCRLLSKITFERWKLGPAKVILGNSGSDAVEAALKTAFLATGRPGVIAFTGGYHGLGYGSLTVTGRDDFRQPFARQLAEIAAFVPYPDCFRCPWDCPAEESCGAWNAPSHGLARMAEQIRSLAASGRYGAILVEPMQGRGGDVVPPAPFLPLLRALADELGLVLIFDEIYTGFYRTGTLFRADAVRVYPDLLCLGKALTGGFPLSACVGRAGLMDAWPRSDGEALHTSTFLGNPLGCSLACESVKQWMKPGWPARIRALAKVWEQELRTLESLPCVGQIRGSGLAWGIELVRKNSSQPDATRAGRIVERALGQGLILLSGGAARNVLSLSPSVAVTPTEIRFVTTKLRALLENGA